MYDLVYLLSALALDFTTCLLCYKVIFGFTFTKNKYKWCMTICGLLIFHTILLFSINLNEAIFWSNITFAIAPLILIEPFSFHTLFLYPAIYIGTSFFGVATSFILSIILGIPEHELVVAGNYYALLLNLIPFSILLSVMLYRKIKNRKTYKLALNMQQYFVFYTVGLSLFCLFAPLQFASQMNNFEYVNAIGTSASIGGIALVIITVWQAVIYNREKQIREEYGLMKKYMDLQQEYYNDLINRDEELRKFRHDFKEHLQIISHLNDENKKEELSKYLEDIIESSKIDITKQFTRNKSVDAVIRPLIKTAENNNITVNIKGELSENIKISAFDICTIISNLLKNAIEACEKLNNIEDRIINIEVSVIKSKIILMLSNPIKGKLIVKDNAIITGKTDKVNHGIGLMNVQNAVKKYGGTFEIRIEKNFFNVEVII